MTIETAPGHRGAMRLKGYDYAQAGAYFVTICVQDRLCLFGEVIKDLSVSNRYGALVTQAWIDLPNHYPHVILDHFVVMPNHIHGIIILTDVEASFKPDTRAGVGAGFKPAPAKRHALPEIVRAFKTFSARRINEIRQTPGTSVWQRNYYEHVIRSEADYTRIAEYIVDNPRRWSEDRLHPENGPRADIGVVGTGFKPPPGQRDADLRAGLKPNDHRDAGVGAGLKPTPTKPDTASEGGLPPTPIPGTDDGACDE